MHMPTPRRDTMIGSGGVTYPTVHGPTRPQMKIEAGGYRGAVDLVAHALFARALTRGEEPYVTCMGGSCTGAPRAGLGGHTVSEGGREQKITPRNRPGMQMGRVRCYCEQRAWHTRRRTYWTMTTIPAL
jgi:hypothetical protein